MHKNDGVSEKLQAVFKNGTVVLKNLQLFTAPNCRHVFDEPCEQSDESRLQQGKNFIDFSVSFRKAL